MADMKPAPKPDDKKDALNTAAFPSVAKAKDDAAAKQIQQDVKAELGAKEANPDAAAAANEAETHHTGKKYRVMDSILEVKIGSIIPDAQSTRNKGAAVWSDEFDPPTLEKRYLDAGAIEVWTDEPEANAAGK